MKENTKLFKPFKIKNVSIRPSNIQILCYPVKMQRDFKC